MDLHGGDRTEDCQSRAPLNLTAELCHQVSFPQALSLLHQWHGLAPLLDEVASFYRMPCLFLMTMIGVGLFLSTISQTQQQAMMGSFFFFSPAFMLSGFAFPVRDMPVPVQYLTLLDPVRYFMEIVRGIFLKGVGVSVLRPQMLALLCLEVAILGLSVNRFHKRLD